MIIYNGIDHLKSKSYMDPSETLYLNSQHKVKKKVFKSFFLSVNCVPKQVRQCAVNTSWKGWQERLTDLR